ncbi:MAG: type II secretion system F family protein [Litorimonas sp.]
MEQQTLIAVISLGVFLGLAYILFGGETSSSNGSRVRAVSGKRSAGDNILQKIKVDDSSGRRKQIEETLGKIEERQKRKKKKSKSLEARLIQADWTTKPQTFMIVSIVLAVLVGGAGFVLNFKPIASLGLAVVVGFGIPRFILNFSIGRRQKKFTGGFADAMDIIVRGVRTGLPLGDCLKIIAHESPAPLGTEFRRVVEGESLGIPIDVCLEQLYERMPIAEVNFFSTVLNIQKTTGGNLGESLSNLSAVLRGRKLLREKIKSLSSEAKMSAIIIGSLPIVVMILITILSPDYMKELYTTERGQKNLMIGAGMMVMGTAMMKKMINFKF